MAPKSNTKTETEVTHKNIHVAIAAAQAEITDPRKKRTAKIKTKGGQYEYKYADLSDTLVAIRRTLPKHGIAAFQWTTIENGQVVLHTTLHHGESETQSLPSEYPVCSVNGDHQQMGAAMSYARRYGLCLAVGISPAEDGDGEIAAKAGNGDLVQLSMEQAKKEINWPKIEEAIRTASSHTKLDALVVRVNGYKGHWPPSYINSAHEEIKVRRSELEYMEKVHSSLSADPSNLTDLLDECMSVADINALSSAINEVGLTVSTQDQAFIDERISQLKG